MCFRKILVITLVILIFVRNFHHKNAGKKIILGGLFLVGSSQKMANHYGNLVRRFIGSNGSTFLIVADPLPSKSLNKKLTEEKAKNSMSSKSDSSYPLVSVSCAPTLESTSSRISNVPRWLGVMGTRGKWLSKNSCLWDSNKDQAASGTSRKLIVRFSSRSFTLKTTESGPKSKVHCVPLLETEKIMIFCKLTVSWLNLTAWQ